jgi:hypothetical protein
MTRAKMIFAVFALLGVLVASAAPAMAQPIPPWAEDNNWSPSDWGYPADYYGYPSDYYDNPEDYYDNLANDYEDAYDEFEDNCIGIASGGQCTGIGEDLDYYTNDYNEDLPYWDPYQGW